jgi:hypothetical protein
MYRSLCSMCVHFHSEDTDENLDLVTCKAFPAGIPDEILREGFDHRSPHDGDNGVLFEPRGTVDQARIEAVVNPKVPRILED